MRRKSRRLEMRVDDEDEAARLEENITEEDMERVGVTEEDRLRWRQICCGDL